MFDHLSWPSVNAARGGSLLLAPPFSTGTGTMCAGGARSQLPVGEYARHHAPDPLWHAGNAVFEVWVMHRWERAECSRSQGISAFAHGGVASKGAA